MSLTEGQQQRIIWAIEELEIVAGEATFSQDQLKRAAKIIEDGKFKATVKGIKVESQSHPGDYYLIYKDATCTCRHRTEKDKTCVHELVALILWRASKMLEIQNQEEEESAEDTHNDEAIAHDEMILLQDASADFSYVRQIESSRYNIDYKDNVKAGMTPTAAAKKAENPLNALFD